jgi:hypothetical protein
VGTEKTPWWFARTGEGMHAEEEFEQVRWQVYDSARRQLASRRPEQPPVTTSDIAADLGLELPRVVEALQSLAGGHLDVKPVDDWQVAEVQGIAREM